MLLFGALNLKYHTSIKFQFFPNTVCNCVLAILYVTATTVEDDAAFLAMPSCLQYIHRLRYPDTIIEGTCTASGPINSRANPTSI